MLCSYGQAGSWVRRGSVQSKIDSTSGQVHTWIASPTSRQMKRKQRQTIGRILLGNFIQLLQYI
jgi:hypothetical protein